MVAMAKLATVGINIMIEYLTVDGLLRTGINDGNENHSEFAQSYMHRRWAMNTGTPESALFFNQGKLHGEYIKWSQSCPGTMLLHTFFQDGFDVHRLVEEIVVDLHNITQEERLLIKLRFGIPTFHSPNVLWRQMILEQKQHIRTTSG